MSIDHLAALAGVSRAVIRVHAGGQIMTPTWQTDDGAIQLYCGDCTDILPKLAGIDAVVTDPPYGVDWNTDYRRFTTGFKTERKCHTSIAGDSEPFDPEFLLGYPTVVLFGATCFSNRLPTGTWFVWDKRFENGTAFLADGEAAWMNRGHGLYIRSITSQGCIRPEKIEHPTQKPVGIMVWIVEKSTNPGQLVVDTFMGSGTTGVACVQTGRRFIGIEIEPKYFEIAVRRIKEAYEARLPWPEPAKVAPAPELFK